VYVRQRGMPTSSNGKIGKMQNRMLQKFEKYIFFSQNNENEINPAQSVVCRVGSRRGGKGAESQWIEIEISWRRYLMDIITFVDDINKVPIRIPPSEEI
jgi:hypothetical protein